MLRTDLIAVTCIIDSIVPKVYTIYACMPPTPARMYPRPKPYRLRNLTCVTTLLSMPKRIAALHRALRHFR